MRMGQEERERRTEAEGEQSRHGKILTFRESYQNIHWKIKHTA